MKALVTGAAHGLGRALTEELLQNGHEVVAADVDTDALDALAVKSRGACSVRLVDLANPNSVERFLAGLEDQSFDLVILNAGISATGRFEDIPSAAYGKLIEINLTSPLVLASSLIRAGRLNPKSKMVFISSLSHAVGYPGASVYGATKDAIAVYAKSITKPAKKLGIGVLTVFPGPIRTDHAQRHAPAGSKATKRMPAEKLARMIIKAAKGRQKELYPGTGAYFGGLMGRMAPRMATKLMRKAIFEKLEGPVY